MVKDLEKFMEVLDSVKSYDETLQSKLGRDRLIVYTIYLLGKNNIEPLFQRICILAHVLFPDSFSLTEFQKYPDSRIVRNTLWHCVHKSKEWLRGSDKSGYSTTKKGEEIASQIDKFLNQKISLNELKLKQNIRREEHETIPGDKEKKFVHGLKETKAYQDFIKGNQLRLIDIKLAMLGTIYTSPDILKANLDKFIGYAKKFEKYKDILSFLSYLDKNWKKIIEE